MFLVGLLLAAEQTSVSQVKEQTVYFVWDLDRATVASEDSRLLDRLRKEGKPQPPTPWLRRRSISRSLRLTVEGAGIVWISRVVVELGR